MSRNLLRRIAAALVSVSLCASCFAPAPVAYADTSDPLQWAAWIGESLANSASDLLTGLGQSGGLPFMAAWSVAYGSSAGMAQAVRDLPEYQALYGYNPLDKSTIIRSYDGGSQMSVLNADGLYNAWLWLHGGMPVDDPNFGGGTNTAVIPDWLHVEVVDVLPETYTFSNGYTFSPSSWVRNASLRGFPTLSGVSINANTGNTAYSYSLIISSGSTKLDTAVPPDGDTAFTLRDRRLASQVGVVDDVNFTPGGISSVPAYGNATTNNSQYQLNVSNLSYVPDDWYYRFNAASANISDVYLLITSPLYIYGTWFFGTGNEPTDYPEPIGPQLPDIQSPSSDSPSSDGPIQDTTIDVTVTLPDGSTTVVQSPTVDLLPIVTWLSIINSNLVAWSSSIKDSIDGWGGNISSWLAEIWKTLDAFRLAVDNWSVSILTALDQLGGLWPSGGEDSTNFWNNVVLVNNNVWGSAPSSADVAIVSNDLERLKTKFPFSVPWDLLAILLLFDADPVTPSFSVPLVYFDGSTRTQALDVDLEPFDSTMATWRRLVFIAFAAALALKSKDLLAYCNDTFDWF